PGCYTDDTQMSIAIAEAIADGDQWTSEALAERFVTAFRRDPREGYASRFHAFLLEVDDAADFVARIRPDSAKSGAAMRASPIGVFASTDEVIQRATLQARITHDTPGGIDSAIAAALSTHYFIHEHGPKSELAAFIAARVPGPWELAWKGKVGAEGVDSVRAAITAVIAHSSMSDLLRACIAYTGDVDTVATIALAAGAHCTEIAQDLPASLYDGLENGPFGRDFLRDLDLRLMGRAA
ncbi:ADP-ribosylglycohydrolase family protein, partial [Lysobacter sp. 2RAB21]